MALRFGLLRSRGKALFRGGLFSLASWGSVLLVSSCLPDINFITPDDGNDVGGGTGDGDSGNDETDTDTEGSGGRTTSTGSTSGDGDGDGDEPAIEHCKNDEKDEDETDLNCGGSDCEKCSRGRDCRDSEDCSNESCIDGRCRDPNCMDKHQNLTETDVDCGGMGCPQCDVGEKCKVGDDCTTLVCKDGRCAEATCSDRKQNQGELDVDCGDPCGQCEVGQNCVLAVDCLQPDEVESRAICNGDKTCELDCNLGTGDCNDRAKDGCESNLNSDRENCGTCDHACALPNTQASLCTGGKCAIDFGVGEPDKGCVPGYADCNGDPNDGCEVDLESDEANCGECEVECSTQNGNSTCEDGQCVIECEDFFDDCDNDPTTNGCEADLLSSVNHCGGCGASFACDDGNSGQSPACEQGECKYYGCPTNLGACDGDGVCNDSLTSRTHCGQCGNSCTADRGTSNCVESGGYSCLLTSCESGYGNCDNNASNGCETNTTSSKNHCGACATQGGTNCAVLEDTVNLRVAQATCSAGGCLITSCDSGYADCDLNPSNGCEISLSNNATRCGGCLPSDPRSQSGVDCTSAWAHADGTCNSFGTCVFDECDNSYDDCNGSLTNGCETDLRTASNCGGCGTICGGSAKTNVSGTPTCSSETCVVSCNSGYCPNTTDPERKCTVGLGTISNCASCGNVCSGTNPFCDGTCKQRFPVQVVNTWAGQATSSNTTTISITLSGTPSTNRALVLMVATGNAVGSAKYGTTDMLLAKGQKAGSQPGYASIYYLLDAALGAAGSKTITITTQWGGTVARVLELRNVAQTAPTHTNGAEFTGSCQATNTTATANVASSGSLIVAALIAEGNSAATATRVGLGADNETKLFQSEATTGMLGYLLGASANTTVGWNTISTCWATGLATATFGPLITGP